MEVAIIDYGAGNVKSVAFALERLGVQPKLTKNPEHIAAADRVIFPGQGAAQSAMEKLQHHQLERLLPRLTQPVWEFVWECNFCVPNLKKGYPRLGNY